MSRSASTFSLSDSAKSSAVVQRSNSLDHPPVRARVPVCMRTPCSPAQNPPHSPGPNYCSSIQERKSILHAPLPTQPAIPHSSLKESTASTHPTSTLISSVQNSRGSQPKSSQHVPRHLLSVEFQQRSLDPQPVNVKSRPFTVSRIDPQVPVDPRKAVLTSPRRETLLWTITKLSPGVWREQTLLCSSFNRGCTNTIFNFK